MSGPGIEGARDGGGSLELTAGPSSDGGTGGETEGDDHEDREGYDEFDRFAEQLPGGQQPFVIYAPNGNINTGAVHGGQRVENSAAAGGGARRVEAHEGPIPAQETLDARFGFAEPDWFPRALAELGTGILFLAGESGSGRRTAALNLLYRHSGKSLDLRALDSGVDLSSWKPARGGARGYLVNGLLSHRPLGPGVLANLRDKLKAADARMVIVLPDEPTVVRRLTRDLHVEPVRCTPPKPGAVFDARLRATVPSDLRRERLKAELGKALDELLADDLMPFQVAELVAELADSEDDRPAPEALRERLSYLAEDEVPELLDRLRDDPDGLAFLLAISVFEGLDHRVVQEEAAELLALADGRLDAVLIGSDGKAEPVTRPNPRFVLRRPLEELLRIVRAECRPPEIRSTSGFDYTVEPVHFTRHRQGETVLRHLWRQYNGSSRLLTEWMDTTRGRDGDQAERVGRVMGLAAGWGGGRRALQHIQELAASERAKSRTAAAYALGIAAQDPVLASEVKYRLNRWSYQAGEHLRWTTAYACGTDFGLARPDVALAMLNRCHRGQDGKEAGVAVEVRRALSRLFTGGNQDSVFRAVAGWARESDSDTELALQIFPELMRRDAGWFAQQLTTRTEHTEAVLGLVRRLLDEDRHFDTMCGTVLGWCHTAAWADWLRPAVETLLSALAQDMRHGVLALFVEIDRYDGDLVGRHIARHALENWRRGSHPTSDGRNPEPPHGGSDAH
ncbi:hypothetical protein [Kitasatospora griseola]|uniref:hypothetical protein n=1 Tax=Kitasatospora griseola TaxID=2064 RepID=UPI0038238CCB